MTPVDAIKRTLLKNHIQWIGEIVHDAGSTSLGFVTVSIDRDGKGQQIPTNSALRQAKESLASEGIQIEFLLQHSALDEVEAGLRATLLHSHIDQIRNVFVSFNAKHARVWIEPKRELEANHLNEMKERAIAFLELVGITLTDFSLTSDEALPSTFVLLTIIRTQSPASPDGICKAVAARGFTVPSPDWLNRRLDAMRKEGRIVRLGSGLIVLTQQSLHQLGTVKSRPSPDIQRLLELAKRGS